MSSRTGKRLLCLFVVLLLSGPCYATLQDSLEQLKQIRQRIENTESSLAQKKRKEHLLLRDLSLLKRTLTNINQRIRTLQQDQQHLDAKIVQKNEDIAVGRRQIRRTGRSLEKRLVALYKDGEVGPLRVLFSADSPTELVQQYQYLTRILESDKQLLVSFRTTLKDQQQRLASLQRLKQKKQHLQASKVKERDAAAVARSLQVRLLTRVRSDKSQLKQELNALNVQQKRLQELVGQLKKSQYELPSGDEFLTAKGRLAWPVRGRILIGFGTQKDKALGTIYESNGVEIAAGQGTPIQAVAPGRVVFADWFKGYGNLLIISHAGGFHSLYAQGDRIQKNLGDHVKSGDILAYSGLNGRDSIYFEIRRNGSPVDPVKWLERR